jgi:hypothetical protein
MTGSGGSGCFANSSVIKDFPALSRGGWRFLFETINKDQADLSVRTPLNTLKRFSFSDLQIQLACGADSVLPWLLSPLSFHRWTEDAIAGAEPASLCDLHVHIASASLVVQLICSWCFCTCRYLMSARVGCEQILRRFGQAGEIRQGEPPLHPRGHDRLRIFCSALATNRKRASDHDEDSSSYHNRSKCAFIEAGSRTSPSRTDRRTGRFEIDNPPC